MKALRCWFAGATILLCAGCGTHYVAPSGRADFSALVTQEIPGVDGTRARSEGFVAVADRGLPTAAFPTGLAFVRLQAADYRSYSLGRTASIFGHGRYSIFTTREIEEEADFNRIAALPDIAGIVSLNRLLLPEDLQSDVELRQAAARLNAEMVVIYTFDTSFYDRNKSLTVSALTLGNARTQMVDLQVTASALVLDTRTGFIYAALEANESREFRTNLWKKEDHVDAARRDSERAAFKKLVAEFESAWPLIVNRAGQGV